MEEREVNSPQLRKQRPVSRRDRGSEGHHKTFDRGPEPIGDRAERQEGGILRELAETERYLD